MTEPRLIQTDVPLVLASASDIRRSLLAAAGLIFDVVPSDVDEEAIKDLGSGDGGLPADDLALILAEAKAANVAARRQGAVVIGCDQTLEFEGALLSKPATVDAARDQLLAMRGKSHALSAAFVLARDDAILARHVETVVVTLRDFSPEFLGRYLSMAGSAVLDSVGAYQIEGPGLNLIEAIDGGYHAVLGLPMIALLAELRKVGVLVT